MEVVLGDKQEMLSYSFVENPYEHLVRTPVKKKIRLDSNSLKDGPSLDVQSRMRLHLRPHKTVGALPTDFSDFEQHDAHLAKQPRTIQTDLAG